MARELKVLARASFDPKLKVYYFCQVILVMALTCVGIPLIIPWLIFGMLYVNKYFESLECTLSERELSVKRGVWFRQEKTIPLEKITDLAMHEGPIQRSFGLCSLKIETAGSSAPQGAADAGLIGIIEPQEFRDQVLDQRDRVSSGGLRSEVVAPASPTAGPAGGALGHEEVVGLLREIRDLLARQEGRGSDPGS